MANRRWKCHACGSYDCRTGKCQKCGSYRTGPSMEGSTDEKPTKEKTTEGLADTSTGTVDRSYGVGSGLPIRHPDQPIQSRDGVPRDLATGKGCSPEVSRGCQEHIEGFLQLLTKDDADLSVVRLQIAIGRWCERLERSRESAIGLSLQERIAEIRDYARRLQGAICLVTGYQEDPPVCLDCGWRSCRCAPNDDVYGCDHHEGYRNGG